MRMRKRQDKYKTHFWIQRIFQERKLKGKYALLVKDLKSCDNEYFFKYFRMDPITFEWLLQQLAPHIVKSSLRREAIDPAERFSATLHYSCDRRCPGNYFIELQNESYDNRTNRI